MCYGIDSGLHGVGYQKHLKGAGAGAEAAQLLHRLDSRALASSPLGKELVRITC